MPWNAPIWELPTSLDWLEWILEDMPIKKKDGQAGLLHDLNFGETVEWDLPLYWVDDIEDSALICALFWDYSFLASAFLLEHCH